MSRLVVLQSICTDNVDMCLVQGPEEDSARTCPECSKPLSLKFSRGGVFVGCSDYPTCRFTRPLNPELAGDPVCLPL